MCFSKCLHKSRSPWTQSPPPSPSPFPFSEDYLPSSEWKLSRFQLKLKLKLRGFSFAGDDKRRKGDESLARCHKNASPSLYSRNCQFIHAFQRDGAPIEEPLKPHGAILTWCSRYGWSSIVPPPWQTLQPLGKLHACIIVVYRFQTRECLHTEKSFRLLNQTEIRLYLPFSDWFGTTLSVRLVFQVNRGKW